MVQQNIIDEKSGSSILVALSCVLFGMFTLPMLPIWEIGIRIIALYLIYTCRLGSRIDQIFGICSIFSGLLGIYCLISIGGLAASAPFSFFYSMVLSIYGMQLPLLQGVLLLVLDTFICLALLRVCFNRFWGGAGHSIKLALLLLLFLWVWPHVSTAEQFLVLHELTKNTEAVPELLRQSEVIDASLEQARVNAELLEQARVNTGLVESAQGVVENQVAGLSSWNNWIIAFLLAAIIGSYKGAAQLFLRVLVIAGIFQSLIIISQYVLGDYSYVLEHPDIEKYFCRVRGAYFYHGAASLALLLSFFSAVIISDQGTIGKYRVHILILIGYVVWLNSTRAICLGMSLSLLLYILLILLNKGTYRKLLVPALLLPLFITGVFYEKPDIEVSSEGTGTTFGDVEALSQSNLARLDLLTLGMKRILDNPWLGQGVGTVEIPLDGRALGGELSTYSSHALIPDVALAAGVPQALCLILLVLLIGWVLVKGYLSSDGCKMRIGYYSGFLAFWLALGITSFFFPQERNLTLTLVFFMFGLNLRGKEIWQETGAVIKMKSVNQKSRAWCGLILAVALGWLILTSPSYTFPVIEFVARQHGKIGTSDKDTVYTNSSVIEAMLKVAFKAVEKPEAVVKKLVDEPEQLPVENAWVLWSPSRDKNYPNILKRQGYAYERGYGLSPGFTLPPNWGREKSKQPVVSILRTGMISYLDVKPRDIGKIVSTSYDSSHNWNNIEKGKDNEWTLNFDKDTQFAGYKLEFRGKDSTEVAIRSSVYPYLSDEQKANTAIVFFKGGAKKFVYELPGRPISQLTLKFDTNTDVKLKITLLDSVAPELARSSKLFNSDGDKNQYHRLNDQRLNTEWLTENAKNESIIIDTKNKSGGVLKLYRLYGVHFRDYSGVVPSSWLVEGSDDLLAWDVVDRREDVQLPLGFSTYKDFYTTSPLNRRYYRFSFDAEPGKLMGLTQLELYREGDVAKFAVPSEKSFSTLKSTSL